MDESRKQFEEWAEHAYGGNELSFDCENEEYVSWLIEDAWQAWKASRDASPAIAYLTHQGSAVSSDDFEGGEAEMHETAKREEWIPLVKREGQ